MPFLPSRKHGLGAKIDGPDVRGTPSFALLRLPVASDLTEFSLEEHVPTVDGWRVVLDQGATSSCVAHAFVAGIHIREKIAGLPFMNASRLYAYYHSRREEGSGPMVFDQGTYLRTCAIGLAKFGVPDEVYWPFSTFSPVVNKRPTYASMSEAHPRMGGKYARIYEMLAGRSDAIKSALVAGCPVAFGTAVAHSFMDNGGPLNVDKPGAFDKIAGNHAMLIVGWKTVQGKTWWRVQNSWGRNWRDEGFVWLSDSYIVWEQTQDLHIIYGWKRLQEVGHGAI